jgi:bacillithiol system protein YtxJ
VHFNKDTEYYGGKRNKKLTREGTRHMEEIHEVKDEQELERVFSMPGVLLFKHSHACGISRYALRELETFVIGKKKSVPVFMIDVLEQRNIARIIAEKSGIPHESPQVIYIENGKVKWHASHFEITSEALERVIP